MTPAGRRLLERLVADEAAHTTAPLEVALDGRVLSPLIDAGLVEVRQRHRSDGRPAIYGSVHPTAAGRAAVTPDDHPTGVPVDPWHDPTAPPMTSPW